MMQQYVIGNFRKISYHTRKDSEGIAFAEK